MIASFGMFDWTQTQAAHDRLWALTRAALRAVELHADAHRASERARATARDEDALDDMAQAQHHRARRG